MRAGLGLSVGQSSAFWHMQLVALKAAPLGHSQNPRFELPLLR